MNIATIVGARPQFIKAALISKKINEEKLFSEIIIHTGQHFEKNMSNIFFDDLSIPKPDYNLNINRIDYGQMIDKMVNSLAPILLKEKIDGIIVYGDTNSTLAATLTAKQFSLPVFHIESGLRSHNRLMHEENNRVIVDHLSSLLFCPTKNALENLKKENVTNGVVFSGDIMYEAFLKFCFNNEKSSKLMKKSNFILATIHRRENIFSKERLSLVFKNLDKINDKKNVIMPLHPHTKKMIKAHEIKTNVSFINPVGYSTMLSFLKKSDLVITDSGGLQKESFFAKKKCIVIRAETEWVELIKGGSSLLCEPKDLFNTYNRILKRKCCFADGLYGSGNSSNIILDAILNYYI